MVTSGTVAVTKDLSTAELICERQTLLHLDYRAAAIVELELNQRIGRLDKEVSETEILLGETVAP